MKILFFILSAFLSFNLLAALGTKKVSFDEICTIPVEDFDGDLRGFVESCNNKYPKNEVFSKANREIIKQVTCKYDRKKHVEILLDGMHSFTRLFVPEENLQRIAELTSRAHVCYDIVPVVIVRCKGIKSVLY
ncbi:MAG: hypothetical protein KBD63_04810 [Bacteriovoracaceae bacterium]|nr:hypothetical protein [Bacteriovoracaceae bacterium]